MPKWTLKDGVFIPVDGHTTGEPVNKMNWSEGRAPSFKIGTGEWKKDSKRRYDKPSESQIKALERKDDEELKKQTDITPVINQSKKDLQSGKIRIDPDVLRNLKKTNKGEKYDTIDPFTSVQDGEIIHIVRKDKAPIETIQEKETVEQYYERMKNNLPVEQIPFQIGRTEIGNLPAPSQQVFENKAINVIKNFGRDAFKGRTIP